MAAMTDSEKVDMVTVFSGETDESVISAYLTLAGRKIIDRAYPYDESVTDVPVKYETLQCEIATYLLNKRGAEGQTAHSENGINRTYGSADVPESMLRVITPHCGVFDFSSSTEDEGDTTTDEDTSTTEDTSTDEDTTEE